MLSDGNKTAASPLLVVSQAKSPLDDDFDPKHFVKKIETDLEFDSDGEPALPIQNVGRREVYSVNGQKVDSPMEISMRSKGLDNSSQPEDVILRKENKVNHQYEDISLRTNANPNQSDANRKFSGIYEDDYFMFVEDYDNFIGEFVSDEKVKIVRGFLNHNEFNRIYYTRMTPNDRVHANMVFVHGFGHTVKYLDVLTCLASLLFSLPSKAYRLIYLTSEVSVSLEVSDTIQQ